MKDKKILIKIFIITLFIFLLYFMFELNKVFGAVELKPGTSTVSALNLKECFFNSYNMRNAGSSLGTNNLDPHLATSKDWGITTYLALSNYGVINKDNAYGFMNSQSSGFKVTIDSKQYTSSTGNKTGIMNMGYTNTAVASFREDQLSSVTYLDGYSRLVDSLTGSNNTTGMALTETKEFKNSSYGGFVPPEGNYAGIIRKNGYLATAYYPSNSGPSSSYRPVIWNY